MTTMPPPPPPGNWGDDDPNRRDEYPTNPPFNGPPSPGHGAPGYGYPHGGDRINQPNYGQNYQQRDPGPYGQPPKKGKGLLIGLIAGAVALVVLLVVVIVLVTRGDDKDPTPAAAPTAAVTAAPPVTTAPATPPAEPTATTPVEPTTPAGGTIEGSPRPGASDAKFLAALMITDNNGVNHGTYWGNVPAQESLGLGYAICAAYDRNVKPAEIVKTIVDAGVPQVEANWVRAAAVVMLCPEHKST